MILPPQPSPGERGSKVDKWDIYVFKCSNKMLEKGKEKMKLLYR